MTDGKGESEPSRLRNASDVLIRIPPPARPASRSAWRLGGETLVFVPLLCVAIEVLWLGGLVLLVVIFRNRVSTPLFDVVALLPVTCGVVVGLVALRRRPRRRWHTITLIVGVLLCAAIAFPFLHELLT